MDGDSYEYAGVASNFLRHGKLIATHVSAHFLDHQALPHPAWNRANLWTLVLVPFQAIFGPSVWTFIVPYQIALFLAGPLTYIFARRFFSRQVALASAVAVMANPSILMWSTQEDPGQPETVAMSLCLIVLLLFLSRRWFLAGGMVGVTFLTRVYGLVFFPLFAFWLLLFRRKDLAGRGPYIFLLAAVLFCSPFFIRNALVFDDPFYSDQTASSRGGGSEALAYLSDYSTLDVTFGYRPEKPSAPPEDWSWLWTRAKFAGKMARLVLFGTHNEVGYYPGIFELLTLVLTPFFFLGIVRSVKDPNKCLLTLFVLGFFFALITVKMGYEDRYLFPVLPACFMLAFHGVESLSVRWRFLSIRNILLLYILVEAVPQFTARTFDMFQEEPRERFQELVASCEWIKRKTPGDTVIMTVPFWSPQYFSQRYTIPPIVGDLEDFRAVCEAYGVDYFLFTEYWGGDRFPRYTFMDPVLNGKYLRLYKIDRTHPDFRDLGVRYGYLEPFDFLGYFWKNRLPLQMDPPVFKIQTILMGNPVLGGLLFLLTCVSLVWAINNQKAWVRYGGVCVVMIL